MTLTVGTLNPRRHHNADATVTFANGRAETGRLTRARNPSYPRRDVNHWWLIVPSALPHFTHDALSLQWAEDAHVQLLKENQ